MKKAVAVAFAVCLLGASACEVEEPADQPATAAEADTGAETAAEKLRKERAALREQRAALRQERAELRRERAEARAAVRREGERKEAEAAAEAAAAAAAAAEEPAPEPAPAEDCDPNYDPCVPSYPPDLDCPDVGGPLAVTGSDPHGFDADGDGSACE
jgi:micrococcal nuclease